MARRYFDRISFSIHWRWVVQNIRTPTSFYLSEWYGRIMFFRINILLLSSHFATEFSGYWGLITKFLRLHKARCQYGWHVVSNTCSISHSLARSAYDVRCLLTPDHRMHLYCVMRTNQSSYDWLVRLLIYELHASSSWRRTSRSNHTTCSAMGAGYLTYKSISWHHRCHDKRNTYMIHMLV